MPTIQSVIDTIIAQVPNAPFSDTVDTVKTGDPSQECTGIVTTFLATQDVIYQAIAIGANLIITHEPTFYSHLDTVDWLDDDPVYLAKRQLIDEHNLVIWRFHDYWHSVIPDGIITGVLRQIGWDEYASSERPGLCRIPAIPLAELADKARSLFNAPRVRMVGDPAQIVENVALHVGAAGGRWQIETLRQPGVDAIIAGEINEWETSEWVRDAIQQGKKKGLIVVGHCNSEEAGMAYLVEWLEPLVSNVSITFVPAGSPFLYL